MSLSLFGLVRNLAAGPICYSSHVGIGCGSQSEISMPSRIDEEVGIVLIMGASGISFPYPLVGFYASSWFSALGLISKSAYVQEGTRGTYLEMTQFLKSLPEDSHLAFCFEHRTLYASHPSIIITPFFQSAVSLHPIRVPR